jgi:fructose/tagatose bisphosphate aldolase
VSGRRIIVYSLAQALAAVEAAAERQVPVILTSAPGMAGFMGPLWFKALTDEAAAGHDNVAALLDCADEAGTVLAALRCGFRLVRFSGPEEMRVRLDEIARRTGATVEGADAADMLDLLDCKDPLASCHAFLAPD